MTEPTEPGETPISPEDQRVIFDEKGRPCFFVLTKEEAEHLQLESSSLSPKEKKEVKATIQATLNNLEEELKENFKPYPDLDLENVHKRTFVIPQADVITFFKEWARFGTLKGEILVPSNTAGFRSPQGLIIVVGDVGEKFPPRMERIKTKIIHELVHCLIRIDTPIELVECASYYYQLKIQKKFGISTNIAAELAPKRAEFFAYLLRKYDKDVLQMLFNTEALLPAKADLIKKEFTKKVREDLFPYLKDNSIK